MKYIIKNILVILVLLIIQTSVLPAVFSSQHVPNIVLMFAIAWTILAGFPSVFGWVVVLGIMLDWLSFSKVGVNVIPLVLLAYVASFFSRRFLIEGKGLGIMTAILIVFGSTVVYKALHMLLQGISLNAALAMKFELLRSLGWETAYNVVIFFLCFYFIKKIYSGIVKNMQLSLLNVHR